MHRQVGVTLLHMHKVFPARKGEQMIVTSFSDVTIITFMQRAGSIKGEHAQTWGSHLGFWLLYIQSHLVRSHRPAPVAIMVPL